jgi:hypothetical protein
VKLLHISPIIPSASSFCLFISVVSLFQAAWAFLGSLDNFTYPLLVYLLRDWSCLSSVIRAYASCTVHIVMDILEVDGWTYILGVLQFNIKVYIYVFCIEVQCYLMYLFLEAILSFKASGSDQTIPHTQHVTRFPTAFLIRSSPHFSLLRCISHLSLASRKATVKTYGDVACCFLTILNTPSPNFSFRRFKQSNIALPPWNSTFCLTHQSSLFAIINTYPLLFPFVIGLHITFAKK